MIRNTPLLYLNLIPLPSCNFLLFSSILKMIFYLISFSNSPGISAVDSSPDDMPGLLPFYDIVYFLDLLFYSACYDIFLISLQTNNAL